MNIDITRIKNFKLYSMNIIKEKIRFLYPKYKNFQLILSAIFRIFLRFKRVFSYYFSFKTSYKFNLINEFWIVRVGYIRPRTFFPYLNIDPFLSNSPQICLDLKNLPFKKNSCQEICIKHFFKYFPSKNLKRFLKMCFKILIPGGLLKIEMNSISNKIKVENLKKSLVKNGFMIRDIISNDLKFKGCINLIAYKNISNNVSKIYISRGKSEDICKILKENLDLFVNKKKISLIGFQLTFIKEFLKKSNINVEEISDIENFMGLSENSDDNFDLSIIANFFEFLNPSNYKEIFQKIRKILKPNSKILLVVPEKTNYTIKEIHQFFDKGILTRILDENNFKIKWINLSSTLSMIQVLFENLYENPIIKNDPKICLLGNYTLRYTHLNSSWWDGQVRAFNKLGYNQLILDIKDNSFNYIFKCIKDFKPELLWIGGKRVIDFLIHYSDFFKKSKIKVVYWLWDVRIPIKFDFSNIIDYMFLSSKGEISLYNENYNIDKIYFMPALITPQILHRNENLKEIYDIGFAGLLDYSKYHRKRTQIIKYLNKFFNVKVVNNIYNNLPEFFSQCKIIFGGTPDLKNLELYSSNRLYFALSCGACYITNYFKGIDRLVENEVHLLWYKNKKELINLIKKYLKNEKKRIEIKKNAEKFAQLKHNYIIRIQNMIDIINNTTKEFYGFLN